MQKIVLFQTSLKQQLAQTRNTCFVCSKKFLLKKVLPTNKTKAKIILIIVGFMYKKTGLLKYKVRPPKIEIIIPPAKGR